MVQYYYIWTSLRWKICRLLNATRYTKGLCPTYTQMRRVFGHHISCGWISCHHFQRFIANNRTLSTPKSISIISSVRPDLNSSSTAVACLGNKMERFLFDLQIWLHQLEVQLCLCHLEWYWLWLFNVNKLIPKVVLSCPYQYVNKEQVPILHEW